MPSCSSTTKKNDCRCCKTCNFVLPGCAVPFQQGLVQAGCGWPPGSCCFDPTLTCGSATTDNNVSELCDQAAKDMCWPSTDLCQPVREDGSLPFDNLNFLYQNFIDTCSNTWYTLIQSPNCASIPLGYNKVAGDGTVETLERALAGTHGQQVVANIPSVIAERSWVFMQVPPSPLVIASLLPTGQGQTLTPDIVMADHRFGFQVYLRDKRNNRYYRDAYGSHCTEPLFPCNPCDGDCFVQYLVQSDGTTKVPVPWVFDANFCRWYLADECEGVSAVMPSDITVDCELACCWNSCGRRVGKNLDCKNPDLQKNCVSCPKKKKDCACSSSCSSCK